MTENETLKTIATEEQIAQLAEKTSKVVLDKAIADLTDSFYREINYYLHEHHSNYEDQIFDEVFKFIAGAKWSRFKDKYEATQLRAEIYKTHKGEIDQLLTTQVVEEEIKRYFNLFLSDEHKTNWRYRDLENAVANWLYSNINKPQMQSLFENKLVVENKRLHEHNIYLQERLNEIANLSN